ncbi:MAG: hypothetical protein GC180_00950 [Bacteroidetes bacterium]|nr:hypothetical protein [Bacteroidota bacterium]
MKKNSLADFRESLRFEYWPVWLVYLPSLFFWAWFAMKSRALLYMTAANPGIEMGGFFGESKKDILDKVPDQYKPKTWLFEDPIHHLASFVRDHNLTFPLILKPNVGERGSGVEKVNSLPELQQFIQNKEEAYLLQECSSYPQEYGILFCQYPGEKTGRVLSITGKRFMELHGDGHSTLRELMQKNYRFRKQIDRLESRIDLDLVPTAGQSILAEPIGNHSRGTEFTNENHLISEAVNQLFSSISLQMDGFYYGRFDIKVKSEKDLETGENLHILEVNGTTSEAGHIYSRNYGIYNAYRDIFQGMKMVQELGTINHKNGVAYTSMSTFIRTLRKHFFQVKSPKHLPANVIPDSVFT